ncbi:unnamed protein product [Caenorhabditis auriculariae]|uniref:peroxidase n=1 Tax=Caenorhabditis auriculariae TaxID=2777116 RepID=A0A8S1HVP2_9PELO|nr:unnamed protein product [Caenorhabditis auriculariae]
MRELLRALVFLALATSYASAQCVDQDPKCPFWASRRECEINPRWMRFNCMVSCGTCNQFMRPAPPPLPAPFRTQPQLQQPPQTQIQPTLRSFDDPVPVPVRPSTIPEGCNSVMSIEVETRQVFALSQVQARSQQRGCAEQQVAGDCSINMYQLGEPLSLHFLDFLPSAYDDGFNAVVSSISRRRPNPREISHFLITSGVSLPTHANSMLMAFGQFLSHDITSNQVVGSCSCNRGGPLCASIVDNKQGRCFPFIRAMPVCGTGVHGRAREQLNENTAFIDASMIYGSEAITSRSLRFGAMLRTNIVNGRAFPPVRRQGRDTVFSAGDNRSNLFVGLAALHASFLRLHNNIAARLQNMNRHWNQDRIFQESRKIVGSVVQSITYQEFLPTMIGPFFQRLVTPYDGYKPNVNPSIINEFASGAYRLHGLIQEKYPFVNANFQPVGEYRLLDSISNFESILSNIDNVYRGLISTSSRSPQRMTTTVTENIFNGDMATTNIQRGRDHGLRSYNDYRRLCRLPVITNFENWPEVTKQVVRQRVQQLYRTPDDLDLYVGGIIEEPLPGSMVGPTFACIIAEQFVRLRDGDRFYFENPATFTSAQSAALRRTSLAWVLCDTGDDMSRIVRKAFEIDMGQRAIPCPSIPQLDLSPWKE